MLVLPFLAAQAHATIYLGPETSLRISWDPGEDGDVVSYRVYYGASSGSYDKSIEVGEITAVIPDLLVDSYYYFAVTAVNASGLESDFSDELVVLARALPLPPGAVPAQIAGFSRIDGLTLGFDIKGAVGARELRLYGSNDLKEWELLETVDGSISAKVLINDPQAVGAPQRFYRLESRFEAEIP